MTATRTLLFFAIFIGGLLTLDTTPASAQAAIATSTRNGEELYRSGCATCHGPDGKGAVRAQLGFDNDLPDFTDCTFSTPEADSDWLAIIHQGGTVRAFSRRMPAFEDLLTDADIERLVGYLRTFCTNRTWPPGDLNLPRPLFTEKAFPENEALLTTNITSGTDATVENGFLYEHRIGARSQYEVNVPITVQSQDGAWTNGLGDVTVAFKHVLFHDLGKGAILSAGAEALLPTGSEERGLGKGVTIFEPFVAFGKILPSDGFLQVHTGIELPTDTTKSAREAFARLALGKSFTQGAWGRSWSPMVELLVAHESGSDEPTLWDLAPQMQVTLSRRQHIMISGGIKIPLNERSDRGVEVATYFLWDWFDGGLFDGWR